MGLYPLSVRACATAMAVMLLSAAPASAAIVPGEGIAGVSLRMSEAQVRARLGVPLRITRTRGALGFVVTRLHYARVSGWW